MVRSVEPFEPPSQSSFSLANAEGFVGLVSTFPSTSALHYLILGRSPILPPGPKVLQDCVSAFFIFNPGNITRLSFYAPYTATDIRRVI